MQKQFNQFYTSPEMVIVEFLSEQVLLASSTLVNHSVGGADNEEFESGGTFTDWK